ncbi:MAG: hypothetical protein CMJ83_02585, partial [Planctomycetes bacterium]|nr:hypothetical protein [Planctomycetota bacterium]
MAGMTDVLRTDPALAADGLVQALVPVLEHPTGTSKAGHPYLEREAWETFRDRVPHILGAGLAVHEALDRIVVALRGGPGGSREDPPLPTASSYAEGGTSYPDEATLPADLDNVARAIQVCRQVVNTAIITAPPDLWLTRHVLGFLADLGLTDRLLEGSAIYPDACRVGGAPLHEPELDKDLRFLLSRGIVDQYDNGFRIAGHPRVRRLLEDVRPLPAHIPAGISAWWRALFSGDSLTTDQIDALLDVSHGAARRDALPQNHWIADLDDVQLAYRLVPLVLGLRAADRCRDLVDGARVTATDWSPTHPACAGASLEVLIAAGWMRRQGDQYVVT